MLSLKISLKPSSLNLLEIVEVVDKGRLEEILSSDIINSTEEELILKNYIKKILRNRVKVKYEKAHYDIGRVFPKKSLSLGCMRRDIRHTLMKDFYKDIDMVNCHATILHQLCKAHDIPTIELTKYILNREDILQQVIDEYKVTRDDAKHLFIILLFYGNFNTWIKDNGFDSSFVSLPYINKLVNELATIGARLIVENPDIETIVKTFKKKNIKGSVVSLILQHLEENILEIIYNKLGRPKIAILSFDGLAVDKNLPVNLPELEAEITEKMGFEMKLVFKAFDRAIEGDIDPENTTYKYTEFEKNHFLLIDISQYCKIDSNNEHIFMTEHELITSYKHLPNNFINEWICDNPKIRKYDNVDIYPPPLVCPPNIYNMWSPFAMEKIIEYTEDKEGLEKVLNHIKILCNNEIPVYEYFIKWIGQMIQYPAIKTIFPTIISKQRAGKGTFTKLMEMMLGSYKYCETSTPGRDIWGHFNPLMANAFFVNLNELGKKDTKDAESQIKAIITDLHITINEKGITQKKIKSYHRVMGTTNNFNPLESTEDDGRNLIIRASDELIGNKPYFDEMHELIGDVNVIKTCFEYFKAIPNLDKFHHMPIPKTEHQNDLKELSISKPEQWVKNMTINHTIVENEVVLQLSSYDLLLKFNAWTVTNLIKYDTTALKLAINLKSLRINGISTVKTRTGNFTTFDFIKLRAYFKLDELDELIN